MDHILIDGDQALFQPTFGVATVVPRPGALTAAGTAGLGGKKVCVEGDEKSVSVPGCLYLTPQFCIPGTGTLKVAGLAPDQVAGTTRNGGKAVLLVGGRFTAELQIESPAQQPPPSGVGPPIPDPTPKYTGQGQFVSANTKLRAG